MTNFVSNAINHVDFDKVIEIKMKKENGKVHTSVFNTGVPIPEADIDKIWIKFYKVDKARTREYGGSGIGHFYCQGDHGLHASEIWREKL